MAFPLLTAIILAPIVGIGVIVCLPEREEFLIKLTAAVTMGFALLLSLFMFFSYDTTEGGVQFAENVPWIPGLGINYAVGVDGISAPLILLTALVIFAGVFVSWTEIHERVKEYFIFLLFLVTGVFGVFAAQDLFLFYFFYEVAVIPMYLLIGVWGSTRKIYASMKLTLYLLIGSAFALIGIIAIYLQAGISSFSLTALASATYPYEFQLMAFFLIMIGFGVLVPMWPMHLWSPDGHVAAPSAASMLHAGVLMKLGAYGIIRVGLTMLPEGAKYWVPLIAVLSVVNVVYGAMVAMRQKDLKFVIGYSSTSHMGYVLIGLAAMNTLSIEGAVGQMFAHGIMTALFFALVGNIYHKAHTREIALFGGLAHQMPRVAAGFMIGGLASLGLPGLNNFWAEFQVFLGTFQHERILFGFLPFRVLSILAIFGIIITAIYVLRVIRFVFFGPRKEEWDKLTDAKGLELVPITVLVTVLVVFGLFPSLLFDVISAGVDPLAAKLYAAPLLGGIF